MAMFGDVNKVMGHKSKATSVPDKCQVQSHSGRCNTRLK